MPDGIPVPVRRGAPGAPRGRHGARDVRLAGGAARVFADAWFDRR